MAFTYCYKSDKIMDKYTERQTELLTFLNDNDVTPIADIDRIAEIFNIEYVPETGWWLIDE